MAFFVFAKKGKSRLSSRFHVAVRLFSNRSQRTSNFCKNSTICLAFLKITKFAVSPLSILNCFASPVLKTFVGAVECAARNPQIYMAILFFPNPALWLAIRTVKLGLSCLLRITRKDVPQENCVLFPYNRGLFCLLIPFFLSLVGRLG